MFIYFSFKLLNFEINFDLYLYKYLKHIFYIILDFFAGNSKSENIIDFPLFSIG